MPERTMQVDFFYQLVDKGPSYAIAGPPDISELGAPKPAAEGVGGHLDMSGIFDFFPATVFITPNVSLTVSVTLRKQACYCAFIYTTFCKTLPRTLQYLSALICNK